MSESQRRVLIAEDDRIFRHLLEFTIRRGGYDVVAVADGEQAWQRLLVGDIDLLVTDQQMPHGTGTELLGRIAEHNRSIQAATPRATATPRETATPQENNTPLDEQAGDLRRITDACILCTAKGFELDRDRLRNDFGLIEVMSKPFSPSRLIHVIDRHFESTSRRDRRSASDGIVDGGVSRTAPSNHLTRWGYWNVPSGETSGCGSTGL